MLITELSVLLDGCVAGPNDGSNPPLGAGGQALVACSGRVNAPVAPERTHAVAALDVTHLRYRVIK